MQLLAKMNTKMDQGYKLTNFYCTFCKGVTLAKPSTELVYCPKCDKQYAPVFEENSEQNENKYETELEMFQNIGDSNKKNNKMEDNSSKNSQNQPKITNQATKINMDEEDDNVEEQYKQFLQTYNSTTKTAQQLKSQQTSKKMGQKLINGWAMLEQACMDCNVPLMKSKQGNLVCCGCDRDYSIKQNPKINTKNQDNPRKEESKIQKSIYNKALENQQQDQSKAKQPSTQKKEVPHLTVGKVQHSMAVSQRISHMIDKTICFLQKKLDQAIEMNDLQAIERVLRTIKNTKELMNL